MTPLGMKYYLPAYLLLAVEDYYEGDVLTLELSSRMRTYVREDDIYGLSALNDEQKKAVAAAMRFIWQVYEDEEAEEVLEIIEQCWGKLNC